MRRGSRPTYDLDHSSTDYLYLAVDIDFLTITAVESFEQVRIFGPWITPIGPGTVSIASLYTSAAVNSFYLPMHSAKAVKTLRPKRRREQGPSPVHPPSISSDHLAQATAVDAPPKRDHPQSQLILSALSGFLTARLAM